MDLFPEGFVSTGQIKESNWIYRQIVRLTYRNSPQKLIALGPQQAAFLETKYKKQIPQIILPCGVLLNQERDLTKPDWKKEGDKIYLLRLRRKRRRCPLGRFFDFGYKKYKSSKTTFGFGTLWYQSREGFEFCTKQRRNHDFEEYSTRSIALY